MISAKVSNDIFKFLLLLNHYLKLITLMLKGDRYIHVIDNITKYLNFDRNTDYSVDSFKIIIYNANKLHKTKNVPNVKYHQ